MKLTIPLAALILSACAMHNRIEACQDAGFNKGTPEMNQCLAAMAPHYPVGVLIGSPNR